MQPENIQTNNVLYQIKVPNNVILKPQLQSVQMNRYQPIPQTNYISPNYKPQNPQPIIKTNQVINKSSPPVNNVQYIVNQSPIVKNVMMPLQPNITNTHYTTRPIKRVITQIQRPAPFINNVSQRNNNYQYNLPSTTNNNYYNNNATRSFDSEAEYYAWLKTQDYINWITQPIKNQYPEYRNSTFSFQPLI